MNYTTSFCYFTDNILQHQRLGPPALLSLSYTATKAWECCDKKRASPQWVFGTWLLYQGTGMRRSRRKKRDNWKRRLMIFVQQWILGNAQPAWCPTRVTFLAATELRDIQNVHVTLENPCQLHKPHRISFASSVTDMDSDYNNLYVFVWGIFRIYFYQKHYC